MHKRQRYRLIADRHLGISMGPTLPQVVIEELGRAHRRLEAQMPDGAHFEDVERPGLGA